jgi:hypothetical protein
MTADLSELSAQLIRHSARLRREMGAILYTIHVGNGRHFVYQEEKSSQRSTVHAYHYQLIFRACACTHVHELEQITNERSKIDINLRKCIFTR